MKKTNFLFVLLGFFAGSLCAENLSSMDNAEKQAILKSYNGFVVGLVDRDCLEKKRKSYEEKYVNGKAEICVITRTGLIVPKKHFDKFKSIFNQIQTPVNEDYFMHNKILCLDGVCIEKKEEFEFVTEACKTRQEAAFSAAQELVSLTSNLIFLSDRRYTIDHIRARFQDFAQWFLTESEKRKNGDGKKELGSARSQTEAFELANQASFIPGWEERERGLIDELEKSELDKIITDKRNKHSKILIGELDKKVAEKVVQLDEIVSDLKDKNKVSDEKLQEMTAQLDHSSILLSNYNQLLQENEFLIQKNKELIAYTLSYSDENSSLKEEKRGLENDNECLKLSLGDAKNEIEKLLNTIHGLQQKIEAARESAISQSICIHSKLIKLENEVQEPIGQLQSQQEDLEHDLSDVDSMGNNTKPLSQYTFFADEWESVSDTSDEKISDAGTDIFSSEGSYTGCCFQN